MPSMTMRILERKDGERWWGLVVVIEAEAVAGDRVRLSVLEARVSVAVVGDPDDCDNRLKSGLGSKDRCFLFLVA